MNLKELKELIGWNTNNTEQNQEDPEKIRAGAEQAASMSAHTPGPWRLYCTKKDEYVVRKMFPDGQEAHEIAAKVRGYGNATLMGAAPELLEALQSIVAMWDRHGDGIPSPLHAKALAAIDKATGGDA